MLQIYKVKIFIYNNSKILLKLYKHFRFLCESDKEIIRNIPGKK